MRIKITKARQGFGDVGDELEVSEQRADRWVEMGIAEYLEDFVDSGLDDTEEPPPRRRGRPPKERN